MGGSSDPSVLRSPGATPQKGRAAHGPRHPAVIIPLRLCLLNVCLLLGVSWVFVRLPVWVSWSSGLKCCLVWCLLRPAPCLLYVCVPSLFLSLFGMFADDVFLSFCSPSQVLGKPKPLLGFGFPLVFLLHGHRLLLQPVHLAPHVHLGHAQLLFFFFFAVVIARWYGGGWSWCVGFRLVGWFLGVACPVCIACEM